MPEITDKERADRYKLLYNSELALRLDLEKEVECLNNTIWNQEYSTPEKISKDLNTMPYDNISTRIPVLIHSLSGIKTEWAYEQKYIGEAQILLSLLLDIIENRCSK